MRSFFSLFSLFGASLALTTTAIKITDTPNLNKVEASTTPAVFFTIDFTQRNPDLPNHLEYTDIGTDTYGVNHAVDSANLICSGVDGTWGLSVDTSDHCADFYNYVTYEVSTGSAEIITSLTASFTDSRFARFSSEEGIPTVYAMVSDKNDLSNFDIGYFDKVQTDEIGINKDTITFNFDMKAQAYNSSTLYVKFALGCDTYQSGFDANRINLRHLTITGTTGSGFANTYNVGDNWRTAGERTGTVTNLSAHGNEHGAVVGSNMTDPMSVDAGASGNVIYHITCNRGEVIKSISVDALYRMNPFGSEDAYWGDLIRVYYSLDNTNYELLYAGTHIGDCHYYNDHNGHFYSNQKYITLKSSDDKSLGVDLSFTSQFYGDSVYIKFELYHQLALNLPINAWPMCLYETNITYRTNYYNYEETLAAIKEANTCTQYEDVGLLKTEISRLSSEEQTSIRQEMFEDRGGYYVTVDYKLEYMQYMADHNGATPTSLSDLPNVIIRNNESTNLWIIVTIISISSLSLVAMLIYKKKRQH